MSSFSLGLATTAAAYPLEVPLYPYRIDADGKLEFLDTQRTQKKNPPQDPEGKIRLRLGADLSSQWWLRAGITGTAGGTPRNPQGAGVYDFGHALQDISPSLELGEAYVDFYSSALDTRIGLQKFAWGKLDGAQPNDLLNPQKFYDPFLEEETDRKIGIPAITPKLHLSTLSPWLAPIDLNLTAVWQPIFVPYFFPDADERWYPPLARAPPVTQFMGFTVLNESRFRNSPLPSRRLNHGTFAAQLSGLLAGADFAIYYFDGYDTAPVLDVTTRGFVRLDPQNPQGFDVRAVIDVFPVFHRIRAAGADVAYRVLGTTLRGEAAYLIDRAYPRSIREVVARPEQIGALNPVSLATGQEQEVPIELAPANVQRNGVEWGIGGDYFFGDTFVLLQVNQTAILHNDVDLLISDHETRLAMTIRRSFLEEKLRAELLGFYGIQGVYGIGHLRLTYTLTDHIDLRIGYLLIDGHERSIIGQYRGNDEGYLRVRLLF